MKFWRTFDIEVIKFVEGRHEIDFEIDDSFFQHFEDNHLVEKGNLTVRVNMKKGANLIEMDFHIQGKFRLTCDRSLEEYDQPLDIHETMIYKYGSEEVEINEDVIMITRDTPSVNVAQLIYEFILINLPAKKSILITVMNWMMMILKEKVELSIWMMILTKMNLRTTQK
ncbi:DUF177 domain-containing protein [Algoriphagus halophilus]|uniref:YceD family protein n=1 Tax=Algoriphagus halophilus TaxID=226505 RepID=UPI00358E77A8